MTEDEERILLKKVLLDAAEKELFIRFFKQ